ncbi:MAG: T9SS type A sorting domain-containing protein [Paludibacter sp.]|nr:T9SS type A sorting domain-containing protein [Paludibacter sp.]
MNENNVSYPLLRTEWIYETNNCILQRKQKWQSGNWETTYLIESEYINTLKQKEKYIAVSDKVERVEKTIINNYVNGRLSVTNDNRGAESEHNIDQSTSFLYDNANRVLSMQIDLGPGFGNQQKEVLQYAYNKTGKLDSLIYSQTIKGEVVDKQLSLFYYDKYNGNLMSQVQKKWNDKSAKWENRTKSEFTYNTNGKLIQETYSYYSSNFWTVNVRYDYIYDQRGLLQSKIMYQQLYRQWRKIYTIEYSNIENEQPNLMESKYNFWGGTTGEYVNNFIPYYFNDEISLMEANRIEIKYTTDITLVTNTSFEVGWLKIYPNPSNGVFYIDTQNYYIESWEVFDLSGLRLKSDTNHFRTGLVDLTELPDGIYMIKAITNDNQLLKQKIIIHRNQ